MGQGYEDHLVTPEDAIPDVDKVQWKKINAQLCSAKGLYTNDIQRFYKVVYDIVHVRQQDMDLSTYIGRIASLKEEFLTLMPFTNDAEAQQIQTDKFFMTLSTDGPSDSSVLASHVNSRGGHSGNRGRGQRPQCTYSTSASVSSVAQTGNVYVCFTQSPSLSPWILDSRASDHISGPEYGKTIGIGRESQGLYHLTSPSSPAACISTDAPLLIHSRLGHPSLSKFQEMVPRFSTLSSLACESCQLRKHTRVSFPKHLNNRAKSPFELVYTDVWGPCRTASTLGFQYFVTFIDDYSRLTMLENIFLHPLLLLCPNMRSSISHLVLILLNKMRTSSPPRLRNASSWDTLDFRRAIVVIPLTLIVYHRRHRVVAPPLSSAEVPDDSPPVPPISPTPALSSTDHLPIALRKGNRSTCNPHPIYNFLSYHRLSSSYSAFVSTLSSVSLPKSTSEALSHPGWRQTMVDEMAALHYNGTWDLVSLPPGKSTVGCRWVYTVKVGPDGQVDRLKAAWLLKVILRFMVVTMVTPSLLLPRLLLFVISLHGSSDQEGIQRLKQHLFNHFQTKDLGKLKYFLGLEIAKSSSGVVMSQRKYALNILEETGMLECKLVDTPMDPNVKLVPGQGEPPRDPGRYQRLVGKLNYLTITRPNISFPVSVTGLVHPQIGIPPQGIVFLLEVTSYPGRVRNKM
ncbi:putative mitochondrial protein [Vitis vinifera]|uniref:Putative mitochondrial protein n=1 Tax=Vitis vinifera TaxID=29760 RepID=A0A438GXV2_VITVI|nr:putative mitochondrial protein [Vitis vinifera]